MDLSQEQKDALVQALLRRNPPMETSSNIIGQESGLGGARPDGTMKGFGYLGELAYGNEGERSTELSASSQVNGKETLYPLITPNQNFKDLSNLLTGGQPTNEMYAAAIQHALSRKLTGQDPFAQLGEQKVYGQ